ncbi:hypothetical protein B0H11DRAFT_1906503 [Mycena galericulata]|nr:hypothetical protein B0H11DRAFT_1906503 [Mycena galericulata]
MLTTSKVFVSIALFATVVFAQVIDESSLKSRYAGKEIPVPGPSPSGSLTFAVSMIPALRNLDAWAKDCPPEYSLSFSSSTDICRCFRKPSFAKPGATLCKSPPSGHGKTGCKDVSPNQSICGIICEAPGFKASSDNTDCVLARQNVTKSELECGTDAGAIQYLSADTKGGCICKDTQDPTFCGVAFGDPDAEMMCSDTTDLRGNREVKCAVKCSDEFTPKDKNTCELREVEGNTVTMAGTASPRAGEAACTSKVYSLPGKGGCQCDTSAPQGGTECVAGRNAYPVCMYEQGSGEEAACGIACVPG